MSAAPRWRIQGLLAAALALGVVAPVIAQIEEIEPQTREGSGLALVEEPEVAPEAPEAPPESAATQEPLAPAPITRITFDVPFAAESGGGSARGSAGDMEYMGSDRLVASGAVAFAYQNVKLLAERISVDLETKQVEAEGNVILDEGPSRITGVRLVYDLETRTGTIYDAKAFVDPDLYFTGEEINKESDLVYTVKKGTITSCSEDKVPDWSFGLAKGRVNIEGWAQIKSTTMRLKRAPLLYFPYVAFPARRDRTSGFLFPNFGYSGLGGQQLSLAYYQTFGRSYDATLYADVFGEDYLGLGTEFRYAPSQGTRGTALFQFIDDQVSEDPENQGTRWKALVNHTSEDLPWGLRGVIRYQDFSDFDFFRDFERNFNNITIRTLWSSAFLSGSWGASTVNLLVDDRETFIRRGVFVTQRQLPELEYRLRQTRLGRTPLYLELVSSMNRFQVARTDLLDESYGRSDLAPTLSLPYSPAPWMAFEARAGGRFTLYDNSLTEDRTAFSGESLERFVPTVSAQIIGPSFSKIFDRKLGRFGKFKHLIEPRWSYLRIDEFDDQELVPLFDEVDTITDGEFFAFSLVNRVLAKPADESSLEGAREVLSFEIGQFFSLREDRPLFTSRLDPMLTTKSGPISARLRYVPGLRTSFELRSRYNPLFDAIDEASLLGGVQFGPHGLGISWVVRKNAEFDATLTHQARLSTAVQIVPNRFRWESQIYYDLVSSLLQYHRHVFTYTSQCYGLRFEYRQLDNGLDTRDEFRLAISLKNIGTFLDLNAGDYNQYR